MEQRSEGRSPRFYAGVVIAVLTLIFVLMNSQEVEVKFFFATATLPLIFALLLAVLLGFLLGLLAPRFRNRGKSD